MIQIIVDDKTKQRWENIGPDDYSTIMAEHAHLTLKELKIINQCHAGDNGNIRNICWDYCLDDSGIPFFTIDINCLKRAISLYIQISHLR